MEPRSDTNDKKQNFREEIEEETEKEEAEVREIFCILSDALFNTKRELK